MEKRGNGILLHITSLPSSYGIGDLGLDAHRCVDFLADSGQSFWQILPLNPTCIVYGNSPYSSFSAYAGNTLLISPDLLVEDGVLLKSDIKNIPQFPDTRVNYKAVIQYKNKLLARAYEKNKESISRDQKFGQFCSENSSWLDDFALFITIKKHFNEVVWSKWPDELRDRREDALREWRKKSEEAIRKEQFFQYLFFNQWYSLKNYCTSKNIEIIGDMPIYVNYDSADVWANSGTFKLDEGKKPAFVSGVPPDYFSATGQLWGHPVYNWDVLRQNRYLWWIRRIEHNLKLFHIFRIDHFRGFVAYWEVSAEEKTAINGRWIEIPVKDFFSTLVKHFKRLPVIAEDLGYITPDVREVMKQFEFPGMKVLLFAFGEGISTNPYVPHNHIKNCVVYTGTHDNNTIKGWFRKEAGPKDKKRLSEYLGRQISEKQIHREIIRLAMMSVADTVIIPMQDLLGLDEKARMNLPSSLNGNWEWRVTQKQLTPALIKRLSGMTKIYGRSG